MNDAAINEQAQVFRSRIEEVLRENNGRLKFSGKNFELFSEIFHFRNQNRITVEQLSELIGISAFRIYYIRKKMFGSRTSKKPIRMKRVKIVDTPLDTGVRVRTPRGFDIFFSTSSQVIEFVRAFL